MKKQRVIIFAAVMILAASIIACGGTAKSTPASEVTPTPFPPIKTSIPLDPTDVMYVRGFEGTWDTNWGEMTCSVEGLEVHCEYTYDQGRIDAVLAPNGRMMVGQWAEYPSYSPPDDAGRVTMTLSYDGNSISGEWSYGEGTSEGDWTGTRK